MKFTLLCFIIVIPSGLGISSSSFGAYHDHYPHRFSLCLIASVTAATAVWVMNGDRYTATMQFRVAAAPETLAFDGRSAAGRDDLEIYKKSQQQYVKSDYVLMAALRDCASIAPADRTEAGGSRSLACQDIDVAFPGQAEVMSSV